jgi:hypothetical protein
LLRQFTDDQDVCDLKPDGVKNMLESLLAEALAVTLDNLQMTQTILECAEEAAETLSPEVRQRLNLVHMGLAMSLQAFEDQQLQQLMYPSESLGYR